MPRPAPVPLGFATTRLALLVLAFAPGRWALAADDPAGRAFFETKIRPVLVERCYSCHSAEAKKLKGGLRLDSREAVLKGGDSGPAVVPGKLDESLLIQAIEQTSDEVAKMPPKGKLPEAAIADFRKWVQLGAPDPRNGTPTTVVKNEAGRDWWSLRPIVEPTVPKLDAGSARLARTPIDAFILAKLGEKGLRPAIEADRRTLIRRLCFDLVGLPPTVEELEAFLNDRAPEAYERVVDRLLASPAYGERWARHWMDVVHFAETHGHDQDRIRPNAWPYRDYLIESFNADKPYARFVEEQLAADVLYPDEPRLAVALGFIAAGPWDESSLRDIREDSIDRQIGRYLDRDDMVATAMSTFVSSTVHCARCHDHKFDPISQQDYYNLQADFAGVERAERPYDPDPAVARRRADLQARLRAVRARDKLVMESMADSALQSEVAKWETDLKATRSLWTVVEPESFTSAEGATLTKEPDRSILSGGKQPAKDTYTITVNTDLRRVTAVRLELLPDDRLPSRGPGRNGNGNLHLTEFKVKAAPRGKPGEVKDVAIVAATADFDQAGWGIKAAIDGNPQTAWGIYPEVGKPHEGIFEFKEEVGGEGGTTLVFVLQQSFPENHLIGRFRLSLTDASKPVRPRAISGAIAVLLVVAPDQRTREQKIELAAQYTIERLERELAALPPRQLVYAGASDFAPNGSQKPPGGPRPVFVLKRGDINKPGDPAQPGTLACVVGLPSRFPPMAEGDEGARRAALARWMSDPRNALTWRSIVNRVWHYHFGRGLVDTPNDFGRMGSTPSHPKLLDWLAARFLAEGGSLKRLHRLIVTSAVYRQSSRHDPKNAEADSDNRLLWRMNRTRLDAESVRDAVLQITGRIDRAMGGPSVQQFALSPGIHVTPIVDYTKYDWDSPGANRRSVYRFLFRTLPDPFMDCLDCADASQLTAARNVSVTPLQALALLNDPFILRQSDHFARRLESLGGSTEDRVRSIHALALGREPTAEELRDWSAYAARYGLANVCRLIFNSNEFLFVN